jgi:hypothetical protein
MDTTCDASNRVSSAAAITIVGSVEASKRIASPRSNTDGLAPAYTAAVGDVAGESKDGSRRRGGLAWVDESVGSLNNGLEVNVAVGDAAVGNNDGKRRVAKGDGDFVAEATGSGVNNSLRLALMADLAAARARGNVGGLGAEAVTAVGATATATVEEDGVTMVGDNLAVERRPNFAVKLLTRSGRVPVASRGG